MIYKVVDSNGKVEFFFFVRGVGVLGYEGSISFVFAYYFYDVSYYLNFKVKVVKVEFDERG